MYQRPTLELLNAHIYQFRFIYGSLCQCMFISTHVIVNEFLCHCSLIVIDATSTCYFNINAVILQRMEISTHLDTIYLCSYNLQYPSPKQEGKLALRYYIVYMLSEPDCFAQPTRLCLSYCLTRLYEIVTFINVTISYTHNIHECYFISYTRVRQ
jgi:hypothetical protein